MSRPKLSILLPPSEGKAPGGRLPPWQPGELTLPELDAARGRVLRAGGRAAAAAPTLPASERYTGVLYRELNPPALPSVVRRRFERQVLIFSGMWGVVGPNDPIPDYRLKMQASVPRLGKLSTWWRPTITAALAQRLAGHVVWDLLPIEHSAAWLPSEVPYKQRVTVRFVAESGATVSHWNKLLKGALVRYVLEHQLTEPDGLAEFAHPAGYRFDRRASRLDLDPAQVVFTAGGTGRS